MIRKLIAASALVGLAACSGGEFLFPVEEEEEGSITDPSPMFTGEVNKVDYDADNNQLVVNNLPFDGPDGIYQQVAARTEVNGFGVYTSLQTANTGQRRYFAVFRQSEHGEVAAIATGDYKNLGFGGTSIARDGTTAMRASGEYVYRGLYGGLRTFSDDTFKDRGGIELVEGDVLLEIDLADFDDTGAVEGRVSNRTAYNINGVPLQPLPNIVFSTTSISAGGVIDPGTASSSNRDGSTRDSGTYQGLFVGPDGEEILGAVDISGTFVSYQITETIPTYDDTGAQVFDNNGDPVTEGVRISYQDLLDLRATGSDRLDSITIAENNEDFQVRELGVFTSQE